VSADAVTVSVVSHGQNRLVNQLLQDLSAIAATPLRVIVTLNIADVEPLAAPGAPAADIIANHAPRGFGANHNAAFRRCDSRFFCVVNPDIRVFEDPFQALLEPLQSNGVAVAGPRVLSPDGRTEDSARRFPTPAGLLRKLFVDARHPDYPVNQGSLHVDWVAGMFMLFRSDAFRLVNGFDERFFLYYEDVDICRRLGSRGLATVFHPGVSVTHDARRASRRDPRLMAIHAASALRYLTRSYPQP
jgi:GT2 family glycosyltransferase